MSDQNWRIPIDASIYLGNQKKRVEIEQRRPTIRKASDLVGPGIGAEAVRLDDYNDLLATFNGYYSSAPGALNAPNATEAFVGQIISDAEYGGRQVFTGLTSGNEYTRTFTRSPTDPESLGWGPWTGQRVLPSATSYTGQITEVMHQSMTILNAPPLTIIGEAGVYENASVGVRIRKQGVYTGNIHVGSTYGITTMANVVVQLPFGATSTYVTYPSQPLGPGLTIPFTVTTPDGNQGFSIAVYHSLGGPGTLVPFYYWFQCTRLGDAV